MSLQNGHVESTKEEEEPSQSIINSHKAKAPPPLDEREENSRKLFVGGLTPETTEKNLSEYFVRFGEVVSCAVKMCRETGLSRGFGFVVFKDEDTVKRVLSLPDHQLNGKKIDPKPAKCSKDPQRKVFVGGLDPEVTIEQIEEHFGQFGKVEAVDLPYDTAKCRRKNYVFVVFSSEGEAKKAASIGRQEIFGKSCDVRVAVQREPSSRNRSQLQPSPVDLHQLLFNLSCGLNTQASNPALLFQNQFTLPGSFNHWNLANQRLSCPRIDPLHNGRSAGGSAYNAFRHPVYGLDPHCVSHTGKFQTPQLTSNITSPFNSGVAVNATNVNALNSNDAWNASGSSHCENDLSRQQQNQQHQGVPAQQLNGTYVSSASTLGTNGLSTPTTYGVRNSSDYANNSPYLTFASGYPFQAGQSSLPYFYSVGPSNGTCYLAATPAGPNTNLYQPLNTLGGHQTTNNDISSNGSVAPSFHQPNIPNAGVQGPSLNNFMAILAANQTGMPFIAYPHGAAGDLVGLQYRQPTLNNFYQQQPVNSASDGINGLPMYNGNGASDQLAPRPLLYGGAPSTTNAKHGNYVPVYGGDQRTCASRLAGGKQGTYNSHNQRPQSGSSLMGRGNSSQFASPFLRANTGPHPSPPELKVGPDGDRLTTAKGVEVDEVEPSSKALADNLESHSKNSGLSNNATQNRKEVVASESVLSTEVDDDGAEEEEGNEASPRVTSSSQKYESQSKLTVGNQKPNSSSSKCNGAAKLDAQASPEVVSSQ